MLARIWFQELDNHSSVPSFEDAQFSDYEALVDDENGISEWQIAEMFDRYVDSCDFNEGSEVYIAVWLNADTFVGTYRIYCQMVKSFGADIQDRP